MTTAPANPIRRAQATRALVNRTPADRARGREVTKRGPSGAAFWSSHCWAPHCTRKSLLRPMGVLAASSWLDQGKSGHDISWLGDGCAVGRPPGAHPAQVLRSNPAVKSGLT